MKLDFLAPHDPRWSEFLETTGHHFYHLPGYARLWADYDGGRAEAALLTEGHDYFFVPSVLLSLENVMDGGTYWDLRSPYGYPGPLIHAEAPGFLSRALQCWTTAMRERRVVSGFVRLDPLVDNPLDELVCFGELCHRGPTVSIDLTADDTILWRQIRSHVRGQIRSARASGLVVKTYVGGGPWDAFQSIYYETMDRVQAAPQWYFPPSHFSELAALLGDRLWIATTESASGEALAAGLFIAYGGVVQHHLQGTRTAGLPLHAAKLLQHTMILTAKARGERILHIGGGRGGSPDTLYRFKASFSKRRHPFVTWHLSFMPDVYQRLQARHRNLPQAASATSFFPAYRGGSLS